MYGRLKLLNAMASRDAISTALSERVQQSINCAMQVKDCEDDEEKCFCRRGCLNLNRLETIMAVDHDDSYESYLIIIKQLAPVFKEAEDFFAKLSLEEFEAQFFDNLRWTRCENYLLRSFAIVRESNVDISTFHSMLILTSVLERALGDLCVMQGISCPLMLKDLLQTAELRQIFGTVILDFLGILFGSPRSLNIRNLLWHGFFLPGELAKRFAYTTICSLVTIGKLLQEKNITDIEHRVFIDRKSFSQLENVFPIMRQDQLDNNATSPSTSALKCAYMSTFGADFSAIIDQCPHIASNRRPIWTTAFELHCEGHYGECVAFLLTQLEHLLRCLFCDCNNCNHRVVSAENDTLFTTYDEILAKEVVNGDGRHDDNRIFLVLGPGLSMMLLDLLQYPEGPRLRDRLSHGEISMTSITAEISSYVVLVCLSLCSCIAQYCNVVLDTPEYLRDIFASSSRYESMFHPLSMLKRSTYKAATTTHQLSKLVTDIVRSDAEEYLPVDEESGSASMQQETDVDVAGVCEALKKLCDLDLDLLSDADSLSYMHRLLLDDNDIIHLFDKQLVDSNIWDIVSGRLKPAGNRTEEIIGLLSRLMQHCCNITEQVIDVVTNKRNQFLQKQLRSRQRATYERMLGTVPDILVCTRICILMSISELHLSFNCDAHKQTVASKRNAFRIVKCLKLLQKLCENLLNFTKSDANRWNEAKELCLNSTKSVILYCLR
jgi:hypothetical protein